MAPDASLGNASLDEPLVDATVRQAYMDVRSKRQQIPEALVAAMLDPKIEVYRVQLVDGGEQFVDQNKLEAMRNEGKFWSEDQITFAGTPAELSASLMKRYRWISHIVPDSQELASALELPAIPRWTSSDGESWRPVVIYLHGKIHTRQIIVSCGPSMKQSPRIAPICCCSISTRQAVRSTIAFDLLIRSPVSLQRP